jgi:hypothetical protein
MRELIFNHSSAFRAHRVHENGNWDGDFKQNLEKYGIMSLLSGITIDRMEGWSSRGLKPRKRHFEGRCHRKRIIGLVKDCLGCK